MRADVVQYQRNEAQVSPRIGVTYKANPANVFHVFYGRQFTPPNLEAISFAKLNTAGTKAQPEDTTNNTVRAERAHYFEVGSYHALSPLGDLATDRLLQARQLSCPMPASSARRPC